MSDSKPGYRHYKGGEYLQLFIAERHEHNGDQDVVYFSVLYGKYNTRPLRRDSRNEDSWTDMVMWPDGKERQRFVPDSSLSPSELGKLMAIWSGGEEKPPEPGDFDDGTCDREGD